MNLRRLTPHDYPELKPFIQNQSYGLCYYSLPSILTWNNAIYQSYGATEGTTLIVGTEYEERREDRHLILPLSPDKDFPPPKLHDLAVSLGFDKYRYVSEEYITQHGRKQTEASFSITEQEASADYIYSKEDLAELKGNKYSKKRNLINQFRREYVIKDRIKVEPITPAFLDECIDFLGKQSEESGRDLNTDEDLICEREAILNHVKHIDILETPGILLLINAEVCAFGISAPVTNNIATLHYEKAYSRIKGLYQYFDNLCARTLFEGYEYINRESDMGDPGLVRSKNSYYPIRRIKSYELRLRT
jgi:hypothetical protein